MAAQKVIMHGSAEIEGCPPRIEAQQELIEHLRQGGEPVLESVSSDTEPDVSEADDVDLLACPKRCDGKFTLKLLSPRSSLDLMAHTNHSTSERQRKQSRYTEGLPVLT